MLALAGATAGRRATIHIPGGGIGISSWLFIHPDDKLAIAILANPPTAPVGGRTHRVIADTLLAAGSGPLSAGASRTAPCARRPAHRAPRTPPQCEMPSNTALMNNNCVASA